MRRSAPSASRFNRVLNHGRRRPQKLQYEKEKIKEYFHEPIEGRIVESVKYPETRKLTKAEVLDGHGKPSIPILVRHLKNEGRVEDSVAIHILTEGGKIMRTENNMVEIKGPINICGDIHGQFYDLLRLFKVGGYLPGKKYLFIGDYVDRGCFGIECVLYLWALKINYPKDFYLLRGNHECRHLTDCFTFKKECLLKYSQEIYDVCMNSFDNLPITALINKQFLCMHGGLSPEIQILKDIMKIDRFREPPKFGAMCDLLWADPSDTFDKEDRSNLTEYFTYNPVRGCSYYFTSAACEDFLKNNNLLCVIRAHEVQQMGFNMHRRNSTTGFPTLITVFSAPNYLDAFHNKAAILTYEDNTINIKQFAHSPHPYWLPNFMDVFTWSLPCIVEKTTEILIAILSICSDDELLFDEQNNRDEMNMRNNLIRRKIRALGKIALAFKVKRNDSELALRMGALTPTEKIEELNKLNPSEKTNYDNALEGFKSGRSHHGVVKDLDVINEKFP